MKNELEVVLTNMLVKVADSSGGAVEFLQQEIPEVVQQLLLYHGIMSFMGFLIGVIMWCVCLWHNRPSQWTNGINYRLVQRSYGDSVDPTARGIICVIGVIVCIAAGLPIIFNNLDWLMILLAPKLYLIEYAGNLIK